MLPADLITLERGRSGGSSSSSGSGGAAGVGEAAGEGEDHRRERMLEKGTQRGLEVALARLDLGIHELNTTIMLFELM